MINNIIGSNDEYEHDVFRDKLCCKTRSLYINYFHFTYVDTSQFIEISKFYSLHVDMQSTVHDMQSIVLIYCNNQVFRLQRFQDYIRVSSLSSTYGPEVIN